jgi:RHS repeat-associated protein
MTVAGVTTMPAASVTVNGQPATNYGDRTFAKTGMSLADGTNTFTAVAQDNKGRYDTNAITVYLPASQTFYYDANGNLTNDGRRYFFYDGDDQLTQVVVLNAWRTDFHYDGHRRKRITRDYAWQNSTWIKTNEVHYVYDGMLVIQERDANNLPIKTYTRGLDLSGSLQGAGGIGGLLAMTDHKDISTRHYYYHSDANGNVTALINEQQVVMARYAYDPFGNQIMAAGSVSGLNPYRFSSKEWHPNSGLYYYGYRFYEPNLQRWINQDPIGERGGININTFCLSDAVNNIDPFGLEITFCAEANKAFQNWIKGCICELRKSARGRELLAIVEGKNGKNIALCPGSWPGWYDDIKDKTLGVITMNPTRKNGIPRKLPTDVPKREVPPNNLKGCAVTLAHELGHAAAGDIDENEDGDGFNVRKNENPVRGQLGIKSRRSYHNFPIPE